MPPSTPRKQTNANSWILCENCGVSFLSKDIEIHNTNCPPDITNINHHFVQDATLFGAIDTKVNEEIKNITPHDRDNLVFLSVSTMQLCDLSIGEGVLIKSLKENKEIVRNAWPTNEKALTSILITKSSLENCKFSLNEVVQVSKFDKSSKDAFKITIMGLNIPKTANLSKELKTRLHKLHIGRFVTEENLLSLFYYGKILHFVIKSIEYQERHNLEENLAHLSINEDKIFAKITDLTIFEFYKEQKSSSNKQESGDPFLNIGGLNDVVKEVKDLMQLILYKKQTMENIKVTNSVLLYGHSGTGKTMIVNAFASSTKANVFNINATDLYSKYVGNPEENIKDIFERAMEATPSLIILDEVDLLCPSRNNRMSESDKRIVSCLLKCLDEIDTLADKKIFILATTNKLDAIDVAFRRNGRFEREIEIAAPNPKARYEILSILLRGYEDDIVKDLAYKTHGFVGSDLVALCSNAAFHASQSNRNTLDESDFKFALSRVRPSAMREVQIEIPNVLWSDIGGQERLKLILRQCVEWPLKNADSFIRMGITPPKGVLMYGPPGCSKTMIAKALATESGLNFLSIKGPELFSKWVGESERAVREVFRKARQVAPSIIFFDEIDALGGERTTSGTSNNVQERVLAQLLTELDGVSPLGDVIILAATNRPDKIDKALLRPGRLDRIVYVPLPNEQTRKDIFNIKFKKMPVENVDIDELVQLTDNYSGAEVNAICHEAAMNALEEDLNANRIEMRHFRKAFELITPRTSQSLLKIYEEYSC